MAGIFAGGAPLGCALWLLWILVGTLCVLYLLGWLLLFVGPAWRRLRPSSSVGEIVAAIGRGCVCNPVASLACPVTGYLVGAAVTLLPGASGWSLAPQYGIILGAAGGIVLDAVARSLFPDPFGVKGGKGPKGTDKQVINAV